MKLRPMRAEAVYPNAHSHRGLGRMRARLLFAWLTKSAHEPH